MNIMSTRMESNRRDLNCTACNQIITLFGESFEVHMRYILECFDIPWREIIMPVGQAGKTHVVPAVESHLLKLWKFKADLIQK